MEAAVADLQDMCSTALTMSIRAIAARYISNPNINIRITIAMLQLLVRRASRFSIDKERALVRPYGLWVPNARDITAIANTA